MGKLTIVPFFDTGVAVDDCDWNQRQEKLRGRSLVRDKLAATRSVGVVFNVLEKIMGSFKMKLELNDGVELLHF